MTGVSMSTCRSLITTYPHQESDYADDKLNYYKIKRTYTLFCFMGKMLKVTI